MKSNNLFISLLFLLSPVLTAANYTINQNQSISLSTGYVNNMSETWDVVSTVSNKPLIVNYTIGTETNYDFVIICAVDNLGNQVELLTLSGIKNGSISTVIPNGKARITFKTDGSVNYSNNPSMYFGMNISFSVDNSTPANPFTAGSASFLDAIVYDNLGVGTLFPSAKLDVNGNARVRGDILGTNVLALADDYRFTVTTLDVPNLKNGASVLMTRNGLVAVPTTLSTDLWISGNSGIRMFTANNSTPRMSISTSGNIGIGTVNPQYTLDINGKIHTNNELKVGGEIEVMGRLGRYLTDQFTHDSQQMGHYSLGWFSDSWQNGAPTLWVSGYGGMKFFTGGNMSMAISVYGDVGIGTTNPQHKLDVNGVVRAHEVRVCLNQGCDFVFEPDYNLMPLNELDAFVTANRHLPQVAPAATMESEGINLSDMNALLLQKVEELTLYVIELNKEIQLLKENK